ncbi:hypothetical protein V5799_023222 [Amblyomma americanum]|uniref:Uncharacterized protein n=1 Tax=Amblyomma americanum TaxID=6943 RepID=A0AAQ4FJZ7_AMBAM
MLKKYIMVTSFSAGGISRHVSAPEPVDELLKIRLKILSCACQSCKNRQSHAIEAPPDVGRARTFGTSENE